MVIGLADLLDVYSNVPELFTYNRYLVFFPVGILFLKLVSKKMQHIVAPSIIPIIAFLCFIGMHSLYYNEEIGFVSSLGLAKAYLIFLLIINLFRSPGSIRLFSKIYILFGVLFALIYLFRAYQGGNYLAGQMSRLDSEGMGFYNINTNTISYMTTLPLIIMNYLVKRDVKTRIRHHFIMAFLFILSASICIANSSRGAIILLSLILLSIAIGEVKKRRKLVYGVGYLGGIILIVYFITNNLIPISYTLKRFEDIINYQTSHRGIIDGIAWDQFLSSPFLGKGYYALVTPIGVSHNYYLFVLGAYGIVAFFLLLWFLVDLIHINLVRVNIENLSLLIFVPVYLIFAPPMPYLSIPVAILYWVAKEGKKRNNVEYTSGRIALARKSEGAANLS